MMKVKEKRIEKGMGQETVEVKGDIELRERGNKWERERGKFIGEGIEERGGKGKVERRGKKGGKGMGRG